MKFLLAVLLKMKYFFIWLNKMLIKILYWLDFTRTIDRLKRAEYVSQDWVTEQLIESSRK